MPNRVIALSDTPTMGDQAIDLHRQMLRAILRAGTRAKRAIAEGKITIAEYAGFMADMGLVVESLRIINNMPQMLSALTAPDASSLQAESVIVLSELGVKKNHEEVVARAFAFINAGTEFINSINIEPK